MKWILSIALLLTVAGCPAANKSNSTNKSSDAPAANNTATPKGDKPDTVAKVDVYEVGVEDMT